MYVFPTAFFADSFTGWWWRMHMRGGDVRHKNSVRFGRFASAVSLWDGAFFIHVLQKMSV